MQVLTTLGFADYELLDSGDGYRLERFGEYLIAKPDPQAIWQKSLPKREWDKADATFEKDGWVKKKEIPEKWLLKYKDISFLAKLTPFKHTGVFPEQHLNWDFITSLIANAVEQSDQKDLSAGKTRIATSSSTPRNDNGIKVLNLFGYTGIASIVAASAGAEVTHVDASRPAIGWARENQEASGLSDKPIRWILDDASKFVEREIRRGNTYDAIIMDPPVYGHGPNGEVWDFSKSFPELMNLCSKVLSDNPLFMIVNAYAISASALMLENVMRDYLKKGTIEVGELALQEKTSKRLLSTGIFARWSV